MPLDTDGRRYANNLFAQRQEQTLKEYHKRVPEINAEYARRGLAASGPRLAAIGKAATDMVSQLADARAWSLLQAYERSGLPFDDAALAEITGEIIEFCTNEQHRTIGALTQTIGQTFGGNHPGGLNSAISQTIQHEIGAITTRVTRDLRIKRDEVILDEKRGRKLYGAGLGKEWDVFISHASEDKDEIVRPLAKALEDSGLGVWFDEATLKIGDSLRAEIDRGLANSRYGIVVLSEHFFAKHWPRQELDGLAAREVAGVKVILPIWHNTTYDAVLKYSPMLAGRLAAKSADGLDTVVRQLRDAMGA
jgi:hypothetical protein